MWQSFLQQNPVLIVTECVASIIVSVVLYVVVSLHRNHKKYAHLPGPPLDSFFMGHIPSLIEASKTDGFLASYLVQLTEKYGKTFRIVLLNRTFIVSADPEAVKEILVTGNHPKDQTSYNDIAYLFGARFFGQGLVTITDQKLWMRNRSFLNPYFQKNCLRALIDDFNQCGDNLMNHLTKLADGTSKIKMQDQFNNVSLDILGKVAFGMEINSVDNDRHEFTKAIFTTLRGFGEKAKNPFYMWNPANWSFCLETRRAVHFLRKTGSRLVKERRESVARGDYVPDDLLTFLVKMEDEIPDFDHEEILDEFVSIFIAGQETSSNVMSYMVMCLGQHPAVMDRLQREITSTVGNKSILTFEDLARLQYLDMVMKETLRLHPPAPNTFRHFENECTLDGHRVPADSMIMASMYVSSHQADVFEDPMKFDPERFCSGHRVNALTYFPFSIGPRSCIGRNFAETEVKIIIIKLLQRFNIALDPDQDFATVSYATNRPKDKTICTLTLRDD